MKKLVWFLVFSLLVVVAGCSNDNENVTDVQEDIPVEQNESVVNEAIDSPFDFTHFDLDVEYSENEEFDVGYESEQNDLEAEIKDDRNNSHLKGDEAFAKLTTIFKQFTFDQNTADEDVISEVVNAFQIGEDYREFELEVKFTDGSTKHYHQTK